MLIVVFLVCLLLVWLCLWRHLCCCSTAVPVVPGLPLLGNLIALSRGGVAFITQCRQKFGDVFCLRLFHQRMVFVFDPSMLTFFLRAPEATISFKPAVEQFTERVYGLPSAEFFSLHEPLLATLRQLLVPDKLEVMAQQLVHYAQPELDSWKQQGRVELWSACQSLVFGSAGRVLFGSAFFDRHGLKQVQQTFLTFEENFEVAASPVPHLFLPRFRAARARLLLMFAQSLSQGDFHGSVVEQLLQGCGMSERYWPNLLLAVLWASQANSMPALFWSLAFLLLPEQQPAREQILTELQQSTVQQQTSTGTDKCLQQLANQVVLDDSTAAAMIRVAMDRRSFVSSCVAEAIRLRLHSIAVRFVSADGVVLTPKAALTGAGANNGRSPQLQAQQGQVLHVPRGSILAICPFESHHDAALYPSDPWQFKPDRPGVQGLEPGTVVPGIAGLGFGGGFWRCPGRFFAEMELALLVQLVLYQLQLLPAQLSNNDSGDNGNRSIHQKSATKAGVVNQIMASWTIIWRALKTCLPCGLMTWARDVAVFGAGCCGGSEQQAQAWGRSGDVWQLLPKPNLLRLVGFKVPMGTWVVRVRMRPGSC